MSLITTSVALGFAALAPLSSFAGAGEHVAPHSAETVAVSASSAPVQPTLPSGSTVTSARPTLTGTAAGASRVALVRGNEIIGAGVVGGDGRWQLYLLGELNPGTNVMQLIVSSSAGSVASDYTLTYSTSSAHSVQLASFSSTASLGWAGFLDTSASTARPTLEGIATPGATVELRDSLGNVYGQATADENYDFRMTLTRDLQLGANQLVLVQQLGAQSDYSAAQIVRIG